MSASATAIETSSSKALHYGLWGVQALLAFLFFMAGGMKLATSNADLLANGMMWVERFPSFMRYIIGSAEVLGAIGLILPSALRIQPKLTAYAALGLLTVMVLAMLDHGRAGELGMLPMNAVLGSLAALVAWGRYAGAPIAPRG